MVRIDINTHTDTFECDMCGTDWAEGGQVYVDGEPILERRANAFCYGGTSFSPEDLLVLALHKLGVEVRLDGERYHIVCHDDEYHGKLECL